MINGGRRNGRRARLAVGFDRPPGLDNAPAVVAAAFDAINHFPQFPAHVANPQRAGPFIKTHPPRIAETVRPDLGTRPGRAHKRIVRWHTIGLAASLMVRVETPKHKKQKDTGRPARAVT